MAGTTVATWVKVKNSKGLTSRPISHKYEGGASFEPGQVITQSEYQKLKSEGNKKREETKTGNKEAIAVKSEAVPKTLKVGRKEIDISGSPDLYRDLKLSFDPSLGWQVIDKNGDVLRQPQNGNMRPSHRFREKSQAENFARQVMAKIEKQENKPKKEKSETAIANKPKRVKTPEQVSAQSARIVEKIRGRVETLKDKRGQSIDRKDQLEQQLKEGKSKVTTNKKLKSSSEYSDMIKSKKALDREIASAVSGNLASQYVKRQKMNKKQIQELNDKINEEYGKAFEYDARIKQLQKLGQNVSSKIY